MHLIKIILVDLVAIGNCLRCPKLSNYSINKYNLQSYQVFSYSIKLKSYENKR